MSINAPFVREIAATHINIKYTHILAPTQTVCLETLFVKRSPFPGIVKLKECFGSHFKISKAWILDIDLDWESKHNVRGNR